MTPDGASDAASRRTLPTGTRRGESMHLAEQTGTRASTRELLMLTAVLLTALLLRLPYLGQASLWLDEMWSIATARMSWRALASVVLHQDSNASLYYALLHVWMNLGQSEATVRLLSVLLGVATAPALYVLGKRLVSVQVGLVASVLVAVNAFHVLHSQEARAYPLVVLLATVSTLQFVKSIEDPTWRNWGAYVLTSVLAVHAHVFAVLVLASHWGSLLCLQRREIPWKRLLASSAAIGALVLPMGLLLLARMREPNAPLPWVARTTWRKLAVLFWYLTGNTNTAANPSASDALRGLPLVATYGVLCGIALVCAVKAWRVSGRSLPSWRLGLLLSWLFVPIALTVAVSFVKPTLVSKYLIICMPPIALLAAIGIQSLERRWTRVAAAGALVGLGLAALPPHYEFRSRNREWRAATDHILTRASAGDAIIFFVAPGRLLFDYYRGASPGSASDVDVLYPKFRGGNDDRESLAYLPSMDGELLGRVASRYRRVWLALYHDGFADTIETSRRLQEGLASSYRKAQENRFDGYGERVTLLLYEREP